MKSSETATGKLAGAPNLDHRTYFINREVSWLRFNERVLEEALDTRNPLLERVKFLSIFHSNLDEFFMVRVSGLRRQLAGGVLKTPVDGMTPAEQLAEIRSRLEPDLTTSSRLWMEDLLPRLEEAGVEVLDYDQLKKKQRKLLRKHFMSEIFPALTPLAFDPGHPFPHISNLSINLAVVVNDPQEGERFARIKVPPIFDRLLPLPSEEKADSYERLGLEVSKSSHFVWLEQVIAANIDLLFPGLEVVACYPFRVTRDADFEIEEDEASDLLSAMLEVVEQRHFGSAVRLEVDNETPEFIRNILTSNLGLQPYQVFALDGPLGLADVMELMRVDRPELKDKPYLRTVPPVLGNGDDLFSTLRNRNVLLYHPYDSFNPVIEFINQAADDPDVLAIKQTLYRVGPNSPVVEALMQARENGKQVAVIVELRRASTRRTISAGRGRWNVPACTWSTASWD